MSVSASQNGTEPAKETQARQGARVKACECTSNPSNAGERRVSAGGRRELSFGALKRGARLGLGIDGCQIAPFVLVAKRAGQRQVVGLRRPAVLLGNDVVDLMRRERQ